MRRRLAIGGSSVCIKLHPGRMQLVGCDPKAYRYRNFVERCFGALRWCRRVATRYDKKAENCGSFVSLAVLLRFLK